MSNDDDVLEHNSQEEHGSVDIVDLLEIANSKVFDDEEGLVSSCLLYTSPSPRDRTRSRMPSSA